MKIKRFELELLIIFAAMIFTIIAGMCTPFYFGSRMEDMKMLHSQKAGQIVFCLEPQDFQSSSWRDFLDTMKEWIPPSELVRV